MEPGKVSFDQIEKGEILKAMVAWFEKTKPMGFAQRWDTFSKEAKAKAEQAGYGPHNLDQLIKKVRTKLAR